MGTDSLYYIMDYGGHYYRTNQADQLVAAAGEQEATVFTLAQANRHIGEGKKASFYCMVPIEEQTESITDEVVSSIKELTYDEVTEPVEKKVASYDLSEMDWAKYCPHRLKPQIFYPCPFLFPLFILFNLRNIIRCCLVNVIIQPVGVEIVAVGTPLQQRLFLRIIIRVIIVRNVYGQIFA